MDIKPALKAQYHAALEMVKLCIKRCPDDLWTERDSPRAYWRIAYHVLFYTHWYLHKDSKSFNRWEHDRDETASLWAKPWEPGQAPTHANPPYTKKQLLAYWAIVDAFVDSAVDDMDLTASKSGFSWYKIPKLDHQLVNLRHIHQHTGEMAELLLMRGIDPGWVNGTSSAPA